MPARTGRGLKAIYAALAEELRRTWQLTYVTAARPGDKIAVECRRCPRGNPSFPARRAVAGAEKSRLPEPFFRIGPAPSRRSSAPSS